MQSGVPYFMVAGLVLAMLSTASPKALAGEYAYFKVLTHMRTMPAELETLSRTIETIITYPVVIETTGTGARLIGRRTLMPVMPEKTSVARPLSFLLNFE